MRWIAVAAMLASSMVAVNHAEARGCIKGAIVGGIAGHFAGHHGMMGAAAGCAVGHHMANKRTAPTGSAPADTTTTTAPAAQ